MSKASIDLQSAYEIAYTANRQPHEIPTGVLVIPNGNNLEMWFRIGIVNTLFEENKLIDEDLVHASIYIAELLASKRGEEYRLRVLNDKALAIRLAEIAESSVGPIRLLTLGEQAFMMYCFLPETRLNRPIRYREYAYEMGVRAYRTFGSMRDNILGRRMERAFQPIGNIVREKFMVSG